MPLNSTPPQTSSPTSHPTADTSASGVAIAVENLTKTYPEGEVDRTVLQSVNLKLMPGQFTVLLGQSGSGKSTLLNLISGIDQPTAGVIRVGNVEITALDETSRTLFRRDRMGFIFQFFNLIPTLTVLENVTLPQELAGRSAAQAKTSAVALLEQVGLAERLQAYPDKLSGGQQQRVAIARALAHNPSLILADEPTGNLDEMTGKTVLDLLLNLTRNSNRTLIMATHNPEIAKQADRVLRVQDGQLLETSA